MMSTATIISILVLQILYSYGPTSVSVVDAFTSSSLAFTSSIRQQRQQQAVVLFAEKQTRSSLLKPKKTTKTTKPASASSSTSKSETESDSKPTTSTTTTTTATLEKPEQEEIYGAKFFGGSAVKEELFDIEAEEQADKLLKLYPPKQKFTVEKVSEETGSSDGDSDVDIDIDSGVYKRFEDVAAFPDDDARMVAQKLQSVINQALYYDNDNESDDNSGNNNQSPMFSSTLKWDTPLSKSTNSSPLEELTNALDFYKRIDVAIIAAKSLNSSSSSGNKPMEIRWEISVIWPNVFESRVLITGSSTITVDTTTNTIQSQSDTLDNGGKEGKDIIRAISSQLNPRFWDLYHVGMTPSAELMPKCEEGSGTNGSKGLFSSYDIFEIPPRLVQQPTIIDSGGRDTREAQCLPNHAFSCVIKTTGPSVQRYITTSPIEVSICRDSQKSQSVISWNVPLPPEYISYYEEFSTVVSDDDMDMGNDPTNSFVYQPRRLVATMKYGGNAQDVEVTALRKTLYEQVVRDGYKPVLSGEGKRPQFLFFQNDAKACFTADGGLGMAVYEWRPKAAGSNEVGIELEL